MVSKLWFENYHDVEMIVQIWGFVVANCIREIRDIQEKVCCNRIAGGVILNLIQWCSNRILDLDEN